MANSSPGTGSQGSPGGTKKASSYSLRPLTIKQALSASQSHADAELFIDDVEVGQLTVVAHVTSIQVQTMNSVYILEDGTGRIEARLWVDSSSEEDSAVANKTPGVTEGVLVRVTGALKNFGNKRYINAVHIRHITDPNEVFYHMLEVMYVFKVHQRGAPGKPGGQAANGTSPANGATTMSAYNSSTAVGSNASSEYAHLPGLQRKIVEFILSQPSNDEGVHVAAIARAVQADAIQISEALDALMDQGHVYSTIDESHFDVSR